jgi:hypothetical protein
LRAFQSIEITKDDIPYLEQCLPPLMPNHYSTSNDERFAKALETLGKKIFLAFMDLEMKQLESINLKIDSVDECLLLLEFIKPNEWKYAGEFRRQVMLVLWELEHQIPALWSNPKDEETDDY